MNEQSSIHLLSSSFWWVVTENIKTTFYLQIYVHLTSTLKSVTAHSSTHTFNTPESPRIRYVLSDHTHGGLRALPFAESSLS